MLQLQDLKARIERLNVLTMGLVKEVLLIRRGTDPLLYLEWKAFLEAFHDLILGLESARVMLACGVQQIEDGQR